MLMKLKTGLKTSCLGERHRLHHQQQQAGEQRQQGVQQSPRAQQVQGLTETLVKRTVPKSWTVLQYKKILHCL